MRIRRIVTGHDADGKAVVWKDDLDRNVYRPMRKLTGALIWATDETPFDVTRGEDMGMRTLGIAPPAGGTRFSLLEIEPGNDVYMHRTDSLDYVICLAGEIELHLDDSVVKMAAGDVAIQRGTNHAWVNRGSMPARLAVVLVDGKPKRGGSL